jgi:hypothetical protein
MPWLPMYLTDTDVSLLRDWLNRDAEVAYLLPVGRPEHDHHWKAVAAVDDLPDGQYLLWHVPSGPLPLLARTEHEPDGLIDDPWQGWTERRPGANPALPYFGSHPGIIELEIHRHGISFQGRGTQPIDSLPRDAGIIGMSCFGWIGNRYRAIGYPAAGVTGRWWRRLRRWIAKHAVRVSRSDTRNIPPDEIYAFPAAYAAIQQGAVRDDNCL